MTKRSERDCVFCDIVCGREPVSVVAADGAVMTVLDVRQYHPSHVLVIPRRHIADIRFADISTAEAVMRALVAAARAVSDTFPADGLSIWHSIGEGANQEVPHMHFHVHPRKSGDDLLRVYPAAPRYPDRSTLDEWALKLKAALSRQVSL